MKEAIFTVDEDERLAALKALELLDTPDEEQFDHLTRFVQAYFSVPVALISLVDENRQWFKSKQGLSVCETERSISFCGHTITSDEALVVENALQDERFKDNPLVINEPHIRFYAGIPLHSEHGYRIGTLCIIDFAPRLFCNQQCNKLRDFAQIVEAKIIQRANELKSEEYPGSASLLHKWVKVLENRINSSAIALTLAAVVFFVVITFVYISDKQNLLAERLSEQKHVHMKMLEGVDEFEAVLNKKLGLVRSLSGLMYNGRELNEKSYLQFAEHVSANIKGITGLVVTNGNYIEHSWFSASAIFQSQIKQLVQQPTNHSGVQIHGPYTLTEEGLYLIAQQRILNLNDSPSKHPIRHAFVIINMQSLLSEVNETILDQTIDFALSASNSPDLIQPLIAFDKSIPLSNIKHDSISMDVHVGQKYWQFMASLKRGWSNTYEHRAASLVKGIVLASLLALFTYYILLLPIKLRRILNLSNHRLRRSERRFRDAIEALPEGIAIFDSHHKLAIFNDNFSNMYQLIAPLIQTGKHYQEFCKAADEVRLFKHSVKDNVESFGLQRITDMQLSDGRWIKIIECPMQDGGVVTFHCDITAMKESEQLLVEQKLKAQTANEAKTHFLANVSHEVRTPLNGIVGLLDVLIEDTSLTDQQQFYLNTIRNSSHDLMTILNDILDISKIEAGNFTLNNQSFSLNEPCIKAVELLHNEASSKGLALNITHENIEPLCVVGDQGRLQQIIINILANAIKFTVKGKIDISTSFRKLNANSILYEVSVQDSGIGIKSEHIPQLMTPFTQLKTGANRSHNGLGLGLAICKKLAQLMSGDIHITSKLSLGTKVTVTVKLGYADKSSDCTADIKQFQIKKPLNILIVDDNDANHIVILAMLNKLNIEIDKAIDGYQAIQAAKTKKYDLILMDIYMPDCDGVSATQVIRSAKGVNENTPVIAFTANAMNGDKQRFISAGMDDYLAKPVTKKQLLTCIQKWT